MSPFIHAVEETINAKALFQPRQAILIAVSGGVDSMVLLSLLHKLAAHHRWNLAAAHFNHQLRGAAADSDEQTVRGVCERMHIPFTPGRGNTLDLSHSRGLSVEMAARQLRHAFLASTARSLSIPSIALAHHANDQVELFFLRLLRGAGGSGLAGMRWRNPSPADPTIVLVRPLLNQPKTAIIEFARSEGIQFREDETNRQLSFLRNRVRHELIPLLKRDFQPELDRVVTRTMSILDAEAEAVKHLASKWLEESTHTPFDQLPIGVQRQVIQIQLHRQGIEPDFELVEALRMSPGQSVTVSEHVSARRNPDGLVQQIEPTKADFNNSTELEANLTDPGGTLEFSGTRLQWEFRPRKGPILKAPPSSEGSELFDADRVSPTVRLRHWRPGDRFQPIGMSEPVKLQDLFVNLKIPKEHRHRLLLATTLNGEIFWVEGLRISERFKLDERTKRELWWRWHPITPR